MTPDSAYVQNPFHPHYPRWVKNRDGVSLIVHSPDEDEAQTGVPKNADGTPRQAAPTVEVIVDHDPFGLGLEG